MRFARLTLAHSSAPVRLMAGVLHSAILGGLSPSCEDCNSCQKLFWDQQYRSPIRAPHSGSHTLAFEHRSCQGSNRRFLPPCCDCAIARRRDFVSYRSHCTRAAAFKQPSAFLTVSVLLSQQAAIRAGSRVTTAAMMSGERFSQDLFNGGRQLLRDRPRGCVASKAASDIPRSSTPTSRTTVVSPRLIRVLARAFTYTRRRVF